MIWWIRSRRVVPVLVLVAILLVLLMLWPTKILPSPTLVPGSAGAPLGVVLPAMLAAAGVAVLAGGAPALEITAVRSTTWLNRCWALALIGLSGVVMAAIAVATVGGPMVIAGRNLAGFLGIGLLLGMVSRGSAPLLLVLYMIALTTLGNARDPEVWAWPLAPSADVRAAALAAALLVAGLLAGCAPTRWSVVRDLRTRETFD